MTTLIAAVALALGYLLGHLRVITRTASAIEDWAWDQTRRSNACCHVRWWLAQGVFAVMCGYALVVSPRRTLREWREIRARRAAARATAAGTGSTR